MKLFTQLAVALLLLGTAGAGSAWADHGHGRAHFGVYIGPAWGPWYYPPPYYYYPPYYPPVIVERPAQPQVYIEQTAPPVTVQAPAPQTHYWYYCSATKAYYPYVRECPSGWQKVSPQPAGQP